MKKIIQALAVCMALITVKFMPSLSAEPAGDDAGRTVMGREFYINLQSADPIRRDLLLESRLNGILTGKGYVQSVEAHQRYHRRFRITVIGNQAENLNIIYYLYTDNEEFMKVANKNDLFEFRGQFVVFTPLSSRRDSYIFDVIMEEGAIVVE
jgi:hypothetical protein